ncbi:YggT family protein [Vibrio quintilis]|uniref:YGGT family protein n=1 Tax=Vibrio quintilis TaxID=1117707 RepID=A0A1M7Z335_9VIBR|nr:YggT family protein [Vibrio quintilis]SHO59200.1 YGGT family protein [Vibrio quintilis]
MNAISFLISTLFNLYIMVVIMRIWLQAARADFYNPFSQFVVKATQPVVAPLRRIIPSVGNIDLATLVFAYVLCVLKFTILVLVATQGSFGFQPYYFYLSLLALVKAAGGLLFWVLLIRAILSWVSQGRSPIEYVFMQITEPFLAPIRRILPDLGGIDLSILVLFILLQFLNILIGNFIGPIWGQL